MSTQPRPWFRFSLGSRAPAPAPTRPTPAPAPPVVRPSFPIRPPITQQPSSQQPAPPPRLSPSPAPTPTQPSSPRAPVASPPPTTTPAPGAAPIRPSVALPLSAPTPHPSPPRAPVAPPPQTTPPASVPVRSSIAPPPSAPAASPIRLSYAPLIPAAAQPPAPTPVPPPTAAPPSTSPSLTPPPLTKSPPTSPVQKKILTSSTNAPPPSPKEKSPQPPSTSARTPPKLLATGVVANSKAPTPTPSPKVIKPQSPNLKPLSRPPSPLTLPSAQTNSDVEQKIVREDKIIEKFVKTGRARCNGVCPKDNGMIKKLSDSEDKVELRVITLKGENKGAIMDVKPWLQNGKQSMSVSGEEGKTREKNKGKGGMTVQSPMAGYFNSNVQGLNNSIVYNSKVRHNDPGIHLSFTRKLSGD